MFELLTVLFVDREGSRVDDQYSTIIHRDDISIPNIYFVQLMHFDNSCLYVAFQFIDKT